MITPFLLCRRTLPERCVDLGPGLFDMEPGGHHCCASGSSGRWLSGGGFQRRRSPAAASHGAYCRPCPCYVGGVHSLYRRPYKGKLLCTPLNQMLAGIKYVESAKEACLAFSHDWRLICRSKLVLLLYLSHCMGCPGQIHRHLALARSKMALPGHLKGEFSQTYDN